jgi:hypothetical protein
VSHYDREQIWSRPLERVTSPASYGKTERAVLELLERRRRDAAVDDRIDDSLAAQCIALAIPGTRPRTLRRALARLVGDRRIEPADHDGDAYRLLP